MTEERLRELQQLSDCKLVIQQLLKHFDDGNGVDVLIAVEHYDVEYARMYTKLHPEFHEEFKQFLLRQYDKYKEAFDNA